MKWLAPGAMMIALVLAGCGGGSSSTTMEMDPEPTAYEMALETIMAAETAAAAQAAYDAVKDDVTAAEGDKLQMAVDDRTEALATAARVERQKMDLMTAASALGMVDTSDLSTPEAIAAARTAIAALEAALTAAVDVSDADKAMYQSRVDAANGAVMTAQGDLDLEGARDSQMMALSTARDALTTALGALSGTPTQAQIDAAQTALDMLNAAINAGMDLTDAEKASYQLAAATAEGRIEGAEETLMAQMEEADRNAAEKARMEAAATAATAAKLFAAIAAASGDTTTDGEGVRAATIVVDDDGGDPVISVNYGGATAAESTATLNVDEDMPVASNHGWGGKRYVEEDDDGNIITEAVVYSDEMPTMGAKFNGGETGDGAVGFGLNDAGALVLTAELNTASRIASPRFVHTAGTHTFELPKNNPGGLTMVPIAGSYYGVAGTYSCTPGDATPCSVVRGANGGYTFGFPAVWTFKPTNPDARVTESADTLYAVYGWWLRKPADGGTWVASAFDDYHAGTAPTITGLDALNGSATYTGGAAGKYALSSSTGGENDAGHFTARATLEADFDTDMIKGTIDNFMGVGGAKDWSVELMKSAIGATGLIRQSDDDNTDLAAGDPGAKSKWTIGDDAAAASGQWRGNFREVGDSGVPAVVTGDFYTEFGNSGKMVGAFGAKTE